MADLRGFLSQMALDPTKLGEFLLDPDAVMESAELSQEDQAALRTGIPAMIAARLAGAPADQAFTPEGGQPPFVVHPPPQYVVHPPPQFVVHPPPQYVVHPPPQFVVHPPPQYVVHPPPQFVAHPPPQFVMPSQLISPPQLVTGPALVQRGKKKGVRRANREKKAERS